MKLIINTLIATATLFTLSAHAEGLYLGGSVGSSHYNGDDIGGASTDKNDIGYKVYGGYSFTPNVAVETGYVDLGKFSSSAGDVRGKGYFVDAVGTYPLGNNFSALGRIGVFNGKLDTSLTGSGSGTNLKVGAGLQYDLSKTMSIRGEWERYQFDAVGMKPSTDLYSVGLNYRF
jgi:OOP family OmpA-OmpF porin